MRAYTQDGESSVRLTVEVVDREFLQRAEKVDGAVRGVDELEGRCNDHRDDEHEALSMHCGAWCDRRRESGSGGSKRKRENSARSEFELAHADITFWRESSLSTLGNSRFDTVDLRDAIMSAKERERVGSWHMRRLSLDVARF